MQPADERAAALFPRIISPATGEFTVRVPHVREVADAIRAAVRERKEIDAALAEAERQKILANAADPSWTEHLWDVQTAIRANTEGDC